MSRVRFPSWRLPDDGNQSAVWRRQEQRNTSANTKPWEVSETDLERLDAVRTLLAALNDAYVSASRIEELVDEIPVLKARMLRRATGCVGAPTDISLSKALMLAGNIGFESELLNLLEDLTTYRADLEEKKLAQGKGG